MKTLNLVLVLLIWSAGCRPAQRSARQAGEEALGRGEFREAIANYQQVLIEAPTGPEAARALYDLALIYYMKLRDNESARVTLLKLVDEYSGSAAAREGRLMLAQLYEQELAAPEKALAEYRTLLAAPENAHEEKSLWLSMARCRLTLNQMEEAEEGFRRVLEREPYDELAEQAELSLGQLYGLRGQAAEARRVWNGLLDRSERPESRRAAFLGLADSLARETEWQAARAVLDRARPELENDAEFGSLSEKIDKGLEETRMGMDEDPLALEERLARRVPWQTGPRTSRR
jgi:TolA-binding protein